MNDAPNAESAAPQEKITDLMAALEESLATAKATARTRRRERDGVPADWEQVGWIDDHGNLWSLDLRNGAVASDRAVYAPPSHTDGTAS